MKIKLVSIFLLCLSPQIYLFGKGKNKINIFNLKLNSSIEAVNSKFNLKSNDNNQNDKPKEKNKFILSEVVIGEENFECYLDFYEKKLISISYTSENFTDKNKINNLFNFIKKKLINKFGEAEEFNVPDFEHAEIEPSSRGILWKNDKTIVHLVATLFGGYSGFVSLHIETLENFKNEQGGDTGEFWLKMLKNKSAKLPKNLIYKKPKHPNHKR